NGCLEGRQRVPRMIGILRDLSLTVHAEPYTPLGGTEFEAADDTGPVIFYGSLNTAEYLRICGKRWVPLIWFDPQLFSCRSYYAHWGKHLLQEHYGFYPFAELPRLKDTLYRSFGREALLFIRPDENDKSYSGRLVSDAGFAQWYEEALAGGPDPAALAMVA